jgi:hypothetical protein
VLRAETVAGRILLQTRDVQATLLGLMQVVERSGVTLAELTSSQSTLEDVFLSLTGRQYEVRTESESRTVGKPGTTRGGGRGGVGDGEGGFPHGKDELPSPTERGAGGEGAFIR